MYKAVSDASLDEIFPGVIMYFDNQFAQELSYMSKYIGQEEDFVQAGGGNTSVKIDEKYMLIKSSGVHLSEVSENNGFSVVDYKMIKDSLKNRLLTENLLEKSLKEGNRPSIETYLHAFTDAYTIHSHPLCVALFVCGKDGFQQLRELFPDAVMVDYAMPGIELARQCYKSMGVGRQKSVVFLKKHGLIVSACSRDETVELHNNVIKRIYGLLDWDYSKHDIAKRIFSLIHDIDDDLIAYRSNSLESVARCVGMEENLAYTPDCVVYCGIKPCVVIDSQNISKELKMFVSQNGMPKIVVADGNVFIIAKSVRQAKNIECVVQYAIKIKKALGEKIETIKKEDALNLLDWDAEKYRLKM